MLWAQSIIHFEERFDALKTQKEELLVVVAVSGFQEMEIGF